MGAWHDETPFEWACRDTGLSTSDLWVRYFGLGGTGMLAELRGYVRGTRRAAPGQYDVVVQAINERYMELDRPERLPYAEGPE
jgi:hypothetical protein